MPPVALSLAEARRLVIAAQGFGPKPRAPSMAHIRKLASRIHAFQIDSVNVVVRAHYVPAFARLGPYPAQALDTLTYTRRELFEYWGHAACLMPISLYPLLRYRMQADVALEYMRSERGAYLSQVYNEVAEHGPIAAGELSNPGKRSGNWWGWGSGKAALEYLYDTGIVAIAGRRGFERLYDLSERVIPQPALQAPALPREVAMKELICRATAACGVGTFDDITAYFNVDGWRERNPSLPWWERADGDSRRTKPVARRLVAELVEAGRLLETRVEGWNERAFVSPGVRVPNAAHARALLTPFDSLVWGRRRVERLFGMKYVLELYVPPPKRVYGYYVFVFLLGDTLVARCDLKADRQRRVLMVQSAFAEAGQDTQHVARELAAELHLMRSWLGLDCLEVSERGDLAPDLRQVVEATPGATPGTPAPA